MNSVQIETDAFDAISEYSQEQLARRIVDLTEEVADQRPDTLVFLDKSARPVSWGLRAAWPLLFPEQALPQIKFVNVGQEKWSLEDSPAPVNSAPRLPDLTHLRRHFSKPQSAYGQNRASTILAGETVWLIDDFRFTRNTLNIALAYFRETYPETVFDWRTLQCWPTPWYGKEALLGVTDPANSSSLHVVGSKDREASGAFRQQLSQLVIKRVNEAYGQESDW